MNSLLKKLPILMAMLVLELFIQPAHAFPAKDLMEKFSLEERHMYVTALVHMTSYQAVIDGNQNRANCIIDWYHEPDHWAATTLIQKAFVRYPDKDASPIVVAILNQKCPPRTQAEKSN